MENYYLCCWIPIRQKTIFPCNSSSVKALADSIMSTIIYPSPIFGPVHSRRLGISLGVNLMPGDGKLCTFDCIYCECGFNASHRPRGHRPTRLEVSGRLREVLSAMHEAGQLPDVITFAGNGEPTCHPEFPAIIGDTLLLRDEFAPDCKVSVLSNATMIHKEDVKSALLLVDNNILKLDTVDSSYIRLVDRPTSPHYDVDAIIRRMEEFHGHVVIQSMFMKGTMDGVDVDNTGDAYVLPWLAAIRRIRPREVMVYTIDRETPAKGLEKASPADLDRIRDLVLSTGIPCTASY